MDEQKPLLTVVSGTNKKALDAEVGMSFLEQDIPRVQDYLAQLTKVLHSGKPISNELRTDLRKAMNGIETSMRMILGPDLSAERNDSAEVQLGLDALIADIVLDDDISVGDLRGLQGDRKKYVVSYHEESTMVYTQQVEVMIPPIMLHDDYLRGKLDEHLEEYTGMLIQDHECTHSDGHDSTIEIEEG